MDLQQFDSIRVSVYDEKQDILIAWHGGHGIHGYDSEGQEVYFWNMGGAEAPSVEKVEKNIRERIEAQDYLECY